MVTRGYFNAERYSPHQIKRFLATGVQLVQCRHSYVQLKLCSRHLRKPPKSICFKSTKSQNLTLAPGLSTRVLPQVPGALSFLCRINSAHHITLDQAGRYVSVPHTLIHHCCGLPSLPPQPPTYSPLSPRCTCFDILGSGPRGQMAFHLLRISHFPRGQPA
jgi:hypothetical protein